jgi:hypothetical protein
MDRTPALTAAITARSLELQALPKAELVRLAKATTSSNGRDTVWYVMGSRASKADLGWELAQAELTR